MKKILIVDDEALIATELEELLSAMGFDVVGTGSSGEEAIEMAEKYSPDLVLMDIMMPGRLDGIAAAEIITGEMNIPVVFITAYANPQVIERAKVTGPFGYILKPFSNEQIEAAIEIALYKKEMERRLQEAHDSLEVKVEERTIELAEANQKLMKEIEDKENAYRLLKQRGIELEEKSTCLEEANITLKVMLQKIDEEKKDMEEKVLENVKKLVMPLIDELKKTPLQKGQQDCLDSIETNLNDIISPFTRSLSSSFAHLTPMELRVADMIKNGKRSKEMGEILKISPRTVDSYRFNIRKKLGIKDNKTKLAAYLASLDNLNYLDEIK